MAKTMDASLAQLVVLVSALFGFISAAPNHYGTTSVVGSVFVNREVTLKATPFYPWGCHVEWKYIIDGQTQVQTMDADFATRYSKDESFFLKWKAPVAYNKSIFYARCSTNTTIKTNIVSLNMTDIVGQCGTLVLFNPVVQGADVKLGYFPSDLSIYYETFLTRTWKKNSKEIQLREVYYVEEKVSAYLYSLTVLNFDRKDEGSYILVCNANATTESVQLYIPEGPSYPILGPISPDFNTTECIYVYEYSDLYCKTDKGTKPVQVVLKLDQTSFVLAESKESKGLYQFHDVYQQMAGLSRQNVTCLVSNAALDTPYDVHGILCNVEKGSPPVITVPEYLDGESSTTICEVHNAFPAPAIEIRVGTFLLADVQQTDSFNISSNTFTSRAKATKTNKTWNGKQMCCTSKQDFGLTKIPICKNISMKYPPSDLSIYVDKKHIYSNNVSVYILNIFCETDASNPPCTIEWESDNDNLRYVHIYNWTNRENGSFRSVANVLYNVTKDMAGVTITCSTICDHFPSHLNASYAISFSESTNNSAPQVSQQWHMSVIYAVAGTIIFLLVATLIPLLFRRCKPHVYATLQRQRTTAVREPVTHVYDTVQSNLEPTVYYNLRGGSASGIEITKAPQHLESEGYKRSNENECHYDYVDPPSNHSDSETNGPGANYIHPL
ncbi:uncharacterized protein LOC128235282 isoform X2 [Mya arenaria]|uniref:uncharacterized protein LOC128235282 isoform X2 n=1 Tax=Mya arenaria TaxID=6604 RepID=UPI0022DF7B73|nr:uncharacterized protein LOC128235282 isoform X2 [Mya arenaria]